MAYPHAEEGLRLPGGRLSSASFKLLAVDLDGTFLDHDGRPHEADRRALVLLREAGVHVSILTGRLYAGTRAAADAVGLRGPVGCADGSHVVEHDTGVTLMHHTIDAVRTAYFRDAFAGRDASVFVFADDAVVLDSRGEEFAPYIGTWSEDLRRCDDVLEHAWFESGGVTALVAIASRDDVEAVRASVHDACDASGAARMQIATFPLRKGERYGLLARSEAATKGTALAWLAHHHRVPIEQTVVVGDWHNDVSMFEVAGRAYAMAQAPDDVKAKAHRVLEQSSATGGGIAHVAAEAFGL